MFFVGSRQPPSSTLFPYTTLFRSGVSQISEVHGGASYLSQNDLRQHFGLGPAKRVDSVVIRWPSGAVETDRKSTRLNSSHVEISYAVFCLKKKKTADRDRQRPTTS